MTWPFENDTSAIVKKLAGRSMQADKRNKAFLLLTIAISVCMVFSILLISTGTQEKFKNTQRNKAQIGILGVTDEQTAQLHQNENITWVGEYSAIGVFYVENKTITVAYGNEDYFLHQEEKTFQGSVPQKADEIMLPQNYLDFLGKSYQTGDTISIDLTGTGQKAEYTLSGVLNNTKESNGYFIYVSKELAQDLAKDSFQVTAYTRLNTDAISSTAILNFAGKAIQNTGIPIGVAVVEVVKVLPLGSAEKIFARRALEPRFVEWQQFVGNRHFADAVFGFGSNYIKVLFFQVDILFLQIEKFRDAAGIVIQHQNDLAVRISLVRPKSCQLVFAEDVTVALVGVLVTVACQINILRIIFVADVILHGVFVHLIE